MSAKLSINVKSHLENRIDNTKKMLTHENPISHAQKWDFQEESNKKLILAQTDRAVHLALSLSVSL